MNKFEQAAYKMAHRVPNRTSGPSLTSSFTPNTTVTPSDVLIAVLFILFVALLVTA